jgi:hypothetical protein
MCFDHVPLLLRTNNLSKNHKRFHFRAYWLKFPCYLDMVQRAWHCPLRDADPCHKLDWLLHNTARVLKIWSDHCIGNIRTQLEMAQDHRTHEEGLRQQLKLKILGLSSLQCTVARQESRLLWLSEGDAPTRFFHTQANGHQRKNHIHSLLHEEHTLTSEEDKASVAFQFFDRLMGMLAARVNSINLKDLDLSRVQLSELGDRFTEEEVWKVIRSLCPDKVSGPDGFTTRFLQSAWHIIRPDLMRVLDDFWRWDTRIFHSLNQALLILIPKLVEAPRIMNFRPITLI